MSLQNYLQFQRSLFRQPEHQFQCFLSLSPIHQTVNDHSEEGQFLDGERDGLWKWFYGNGERMFEGEFQSGVPVNRHKYWYDDGQVEMTGKYKAGEMEGRWDYYDDNGFPLMQLDYKEGVVVRIDGQKIRLPEQAEE